MANEIHPWLGLVLTVIMLAVMYNTILGLTYSFAHVSLSHTVKISYIYCYYDDCTFILSFVGFADLINFLYNIMGVVGLFIVVAVLIKYYLRKSDNKDHIA